MRRAAGAPAGAAGGNRKPLRRARAVPWRHHGQARGSAGELRGAPPVAAGRAPAQGARRAGRGPAHRAEPAQAHRETGQCRRAACVLCRRSADRQAQGAVPAPARAAARPGQGRRYRRPRQEPARPGVSRAAGPQRAVRRRRRHHPPGPPPLQRGQPGTGPDPAAAQRRIVPAPGRHRVFRARGQSRAGRFAGLLGCLHAGRIGRLLSR